MNGQVCSIDLMQSDGIDQGLVSSGDDGRRLTRPGTFADIFLASDGRGGDDDLTGRLLERDIGSNQRQGRRADNR